MLRTLPSQVLRFAASVAVIVLLAARPAAAAPQKPAPSPNPQAKLEDRVNQLEKDLRAAEQKAASAAMEKEYILRTQNHYEAYYKEVFSTQTHILWTIGVTVTLLSITLTAVFFLAGRFGFNIFDRRIEMSLQEASAKLRTEFAERLANETNALQEAHAAELKTLEAALTKRIGELEDSLAKRITQQVEDLETRSNFQFRHSEGLAAGADNRNTAARGSFRWALKIYKSSRPRKLLSKHLGALAATNLFTAIEREDKANFVENAKKELAAEFYNDLGEELALAAVDLTWLGPLLKERKSTTSQAAPAESKTGEAASNAPQPAATPKADK